MQGMTRILALVLTLILSHLSNTSFTSTAQANVRLATLSGTIEKAPRNIDLSSEGLNDWVHYDRLNKNNRKVVTYRKTDVTPQISDAKILGKVRFFAPVSTYHWTDGTRKSSNSTKKAIRVTTIGNEFEISVPADTTPKTLKVFVGIKKASGRLEATLSDGSTAPFSMQIDQLSRRSGRIITLNYQAASSGQTLTVKYTLTNKFDNYTQSYISLEAAALIGTANDIPTNIANPGNENSNQSTTNKQTKGSLKNLNKNTVSMKINPLRDLGLEKGKQACFRLKSYNNVTKSNFSNAACGRISNNHSLTLAWDKATGDITGYQIYFGTNGKISEMNFLADMIEN